MSWSIFLSSVERISQKKSATWLQGKEKERHFKHELYLKRRTFWQNVLDDRVWERLLA